MSHVPSDSSTALQHTGDRLHYQLCCIFCHNHHGALHAMDISACLLWTGKLLGTTHSFRNSFSWQLRGCVYSCVWVRVYHSFHVCVQRKTSGVGSCLLPSFERGTPCLQTAHTRLGESPISIFHTDVWVLGYRCALLHTALCAFWGSQPKSSCLHGSTVPNDGFSSAVSSILVRWQRDLISHPGKWTGYSFMLPF